MSPRALLGLLCALLLALLALPTSAEARREEDQPLTRAQENSYLERLYSGLDKNKDGAVSGLELFGQEGKGQSPASDTDGNESLSVEELKAFWLTSSVHGWGEREVERWLSEIGMDKYAPLFAQRKITGRTLPSLAMEDGKVLLSFGVDEADRAVLVEHILRAVFGYSAPGSSKLRDGLLLASSCSLCLLSLLFYKKQQAYNDSVRLVEERMRAAQEEAQKNEGFFKRQIEEFSTHTEDVKSQLKEVEQEKEKLKLVRQDSEKNAQQLLTEISTLRSERAEIEKWLNDKFAQEVAAWGKKWSLLLRQIDANREVLQKLEKKTPFFNRTGKAIEQGRQMELLEADIESWRKNYILFLEDWQRLSSASNVHIRDLKERVSSLKNEAKATEAKATEAKAAQA